MVVTELHMQLHGTSPMHRLHAAQALRIEHAVHQ